MSARLLRRNLLAPQLSTRRLSSASFLAARPRSPPLGEEGRLGRGKNGGSSSSSSSNGISSSNNSCSSNSNSNTSSSSRRRWSRSTRSSGPIQFPGPQAVGGLGALSLRSFASEANRPHQDIEDSQHRVARTLDLLHGYSTEAHPGHQPGRFAGPGPEYEGMIHDPKTGRWRLADVSSNATDPSSASALALLSTEDKALASRFEQQGGLALTLANAFRKPDLLRAEARRLTSRAEGKASNLPGEDHSEPLLPEAELDAAMAEIFSTAGFSAATSLLENLEGDIPRAILLFQAADMAEEREAVMRNVWSDVDFQAGEEGNAELVERLEHQFAHQLVKTTRNRRSAERDAAVRREALGPPPSSPDSQTSTATSPREASEDTRDDEDVDAIVGICSSGGGSDVAELSQMSRQELNTTLLEPRNLGVALDLVGVYLKNYEIDKADQVITRILPLCRQRSTTWLCKGLDKLSAVRMKQFRAYEALAALKEIEQIVPFGPDESWEFHDILYRNLAWCYSSLDEPERTLHYTAKSMEVKKNAGIPASWFDLWDMGKAHARLGQKTNEVEEMETAFDLVSKAAEVIRIAEPGDSIMLAKICSNIGEVAMGIGDYHHLRGDEEAAAAWYPRAEEPLLESYHLHSGALGSNKPLAGWAAGTVAHCMVRLQRYEEARKFLLIAWNVECTKDSTTPGSVVELLDRCVAVHQQLERNKGLLDFLPSLQTGLENLKKHGWHEKEPNVYGLLLQRASTAFLLAHDSSAAGVRAACSTLREAEALLKNCSGSSANPFGRTKADDSHNDEGEVLSKMGQDAVDVEQKQFGPRADVGELLESVRASLRILEIAEEALGGQREDRLAEDQAGATFEPVFQEEEKPAAPKKRKSTFPI